MKTRILDEMLADFASDVSMEYSCLSYKLGVASPMPCLKKTTAAIVERYNYLKSVNRHEFPEMLFRIAVISVATPYPTLTAVNSKYVLSQALQYVAVQYAPKHIPPALALAA